MNSWLASSPKPSVHPNRRDWNKDADMAHAATISTATPAAFSTGGNGIGLLIVTTLPALFWGGVLYAVCSLIGIAVSLTTLCGVGIAIAAFLAIIFRALMTH